VAEIRVLDAVVRHTHSHHIERPASAALAELTYSYRPHALSPERLFRLQHDGLAWSMASRKGMVAYRDIEQVQIFKARFLGSSATYWNVVLLSRTGGRIKLAAASRVGFKAVDDRTSVYLPFVHELQARLRQANPGLRVETGRHWLLHLEAAAGWLVVRLFKLLRHVSLRWSSNAAAWLMRRIGPGLLRGHRTAKAQLAIAYPEKSAAEIDRILTGMWDNLARVTAEYVQLDRLWDFDLDNPHRQRRIVLDDATIERCERLRERRGPVLMFGAHLGNWEVSALAAQMFAPDVDVIFKAPRVAAIADKLVELRSSSGAGLLPADASTALRVRDALKANRMVGLLVDEHYAAGIPVTVFNRAFKINPLFARFVRIFDCPFHGFYVARTPDGRLRLTVTDAIEPVRDARGRVDVNGTMQTIASTVEGWVRAHPEQWLWLHRRWRD
jgi:KDO2-lipid IV(A) lauroyltransferase